MFEAFLAGDNMDRHPFHLRIAHVAAGVWLLMSCAPQPVSEPSPLVLSSCSLPDLNEHVLCGALSVFENRDARSGRRIHLRVAVLPALGTALRADPIFFIVGGPGQSAVQSAASYAALFSPLRAERAMVFIDQRGTGSRILTARRCACIMLMKARAMRP